MRLKNILGADENVIKEQIRNYFFNEGYLNREKGKDYYYRVFGKFYDNNPFLMNNERLMISKNSYIKGYNYQSA